MRTAADIPTGPTPRRRLTDAQRDLVEANMQLVWHIIHRMRSHQDVPVADQEDMFQCGCLGLIAAALRFDPARGRAFSTFAAPRIRGAILDAYRSYDTLDRKHRAEVRAAGKTVGHESYSETTQRMTEEEDALSPMKRNHVHSQSDVERIFRASVKRLRESGKKFGWTEVEITRQATLLAARIGQKAIGG